MPQKQNELLVANSIADAFTGRFCPYCGEEPQQLFKHIKECGIVHENVQAGLDIAAKGSKFGQHTICGEVMILAVDRGLALVENDDARYVLPASSIKCHGEGINDIISIIQHTNFNSEQLDKIRKFLCKIAGKHDDIGNGCRVEIDLRGEPHYGTVIRKKGPGQYIIDLDNGPRVNITSKQIKRLY